MTRVVAIGATHEIEGFALAGVRVMTADARTDVMAAWSRLDDTVGLVILSPDAADVLRSRLTERPDVLTSVMP